MPLSLPTFREIAQSILAGVQRLEELSNTTEDEWVRLSLEETDNAVWGLVDHIEEVTRGLLLDSTESTERSEEGN